MANFNGKITITFKDGLADLTMDAGAAKIPVGILDRWMRTKGIKLFRIQQRNMSKPPTVVEKKASPEKPKTVAEALSSDKKTLHSVVDRKPLPDIEVPGPMPPEPPVVKATPEDKETARFMAGRAQPEQPHPEMDKIDAAIARANSEKTDNSATEEKQNET